MGSARRSKKFAKAQLRKVLGAAPPRGQMTRIRAKESGSIRVMDADNFVTETARGLVAFRSYVRELVERRHLIGVLSGRELKANYEMNIVGFAWWLLEPLSLTVVYFVLINIIRGGGSKPTPGPPQLLVILVAMLPFKWLSSSLIGSMGAVRANANLVTDVYFPRSLLPMTEIVTGLAHFLVGLLVLPPFMLVLHVAPGISLIWLPVVLLAQFVLMLGLAYPLCVWGLNYRNLPGLIGNILRLWFYMSPGIWTLDRFANKPGLLLAIKLNPLTGIFEGYRRAIITHQNPDWSTLWSLVFGAVLAFIGGWYFSRRESQFGKML